MFIIAHWNMFMITALNLLSNRSTISDISVFHSIWLSFVIQCENFIDFALTSKFQEEPGHSALCQATVDLSWSFLCFSWLLLTSLLLSRVGGSGCHWASTDTSLAGRRQCVSRLLPTHFPLTLWYGRVVSWSLGGDESPSFYLAFSDMTPVVHLGTPHFILASC